MSAAQSMPGKLTGWHVLAMVVGFFAIVVGADIYFAVLAYRTMPGETAANPYEAGITYQRVLDQKAREAKLGWRAQIRPLVNGAIEVAITDRVGAPLSDLTVRGRLTRPATERGSRTVAFIPAGPGLYRLAAANEKGAWDIDVTASDGHGGQLDVSRRLQWP